MATANIYFDKRAQKNDGTYPIKITISHKGATSRINLDISIKIEQWNEIEHKIISHPNKNTLNNFIMQRLIEVRNILMSAKQSGDLINKTITEIRDMVINRLNPNSENETTFTEWYKRFQNRHDNPRTRSIYNETWKWIEKFDRNNKKLYFSHITKDWLERFSLFMIPSSPSQNARNIHLRNIRAVFNDAIDNDITTLYPFRRLKIRPVETAKRNLKANQLQILFNAEVHEWQQKYIDAFKLMFLLIGINIGDLCSLTEHDIIDNRINYNRKKTHRLYSIKIEPEAWEIIKKYQGKDKLLNFTEQSKNYRSFADKMNRTLKTIIPGVTTYWSRHSWATIAASLDIPEDVISAALGHSGNNNTTRIYIEREHRKIDNANRCVIDYVFYNNNTKK